MQYIPRPYLFISTASLPPIQKPYSLYESPLVGGQNGIQVLGQWTFVLEEFGYNIPNYISSLDIGPNPSAQIKVVITITLTRHKLKGFKRFDVLCSAFSLNNEHVSF